MMPVFIPNRVEFTAQEGGKPKKGSKKGSKKTTKKSSKASSKTASKKSSKASSKTSSKKNKIIMKGGNNDIYENYFDLIVKQINEYCENTPYNLEKKMVQISIDDWVQDGYNRVDKNFEIDKDSIIRSLKDKISLQEIMKLNRKTQEMKVLQERVLKHIDDIFKDSKTKHNQKSCHGIFKNYFSTDNIYITYEDLIRTNKDSELIAVGFTPVIYKTLKYSIPVRDFINNGYTLEKLVASGATLRDLLQKIGYEEIKKGGYTLKNLVDSGITLDDLLNNNIKYEEILNSLSLQDLKNIGVNLDNIVKYRNPISSIDELDKAGFINNGLKILDLFKSGKYKYGEIKEKIKQKYPQKSKELEYFENELDKVKKDCPTKFSNFKLHTNPDCLYPNKLPSNLNGGAKISSQKGSKKASKKGSKKTSKKGSKKTSKKGSKKPTKKTTKTGSKKPTKKTTKTGSKKPIKKATKKGTKSGLKN